MVVSVVVSKRFLNDFKDLTDVINVMDELYYYTTTTIQEFNDFKDLAGEVHVMDELYYYYTTTTIQEFNDFNWLQCVVHVMDEPYTIVVWQRFWLKINDLAGEVKP
jgi:hypothetical protein